MYSRYTTLQRAQLAKQEYLDTQDVFLAVYAPGRRASLEASCATSSTASSCWRRTFPAGVWAAPAACCWRKKI